MKFTATKWPVTITYEIADDYFDGIEEGSMDKTIGTMDELEEAAAQASDYFIKAKGIVLARQEAKRKQG